MTDRTAARKGNTSLTFQPHLAGPDEAAAACEAALPGHQRGPRGAAAAGGADAVARRAGSLPSTGPVGSVPIGGGGGLAALRGYQADAVEAIDAGLRGGGRGQLVAACGSGKSIVAVHVGLRLCPVGVVVVSCPSLPLLAQTLAVWTNAGVPGEVLAVCSDETVADDAVEVGDLACPVTIRSGEVADWLRRAPAGRLRLILVTHHSAAVVGAGLHQAGATADLLVVDEAHRTAGSAGKAFARLHDDENLPATRRLYLTATRRLLSAGRVGRTAAAVEVLSMDDEAVFGPVLFRYPFGAAIADGWLDDYQVVAVGVTRADLLQLLREADVDAVAEPGGARLHTVVVQAALLRAVVEFGLRRVLVFTPRIADSKEFIRTLPTTVRQLPDHQRPKGLLTAGHVDGKQTVSQRGRHLRQLAHPPEDGWTVLSSARCLGEGVDVPAVDAVAFTRPKRSEVDVVQAVGRALRRHPGGSGIATVLVPVLLPDDPDEISDHLGQWATLWQVLRALRAHDERLAAALDTRRGEYVNGGTPQIPQRVLLRLPDGYATGQVLEHITVRLIEHTTSTWPAAYAALCAFRAEHGHVRLPHRYRVGNVDLHSWLRYQVACHRSGQLPADRTEALRKLGVALETSPDAWDRGLPAAQAFHAEHGHLHPRATDVIDGVKLYDWLRGRRRLYDCGELSDQQAAALAAMDPTWYQRRRPPRHTWEQGLAAAATFHREHGHLRPPHRTRVNGIDLQDWLAVRRKLFHDGRLPTEHAQALTALDPNWSKRTAVDFDDGLAAARAFHANNGHLRVPDRARVNGIRLQNWISSARRKYHAGELSAEQITALDALGIVWSITESAWERGLAAATAYHARTGHLTVPRAHREAGFVLATWVERQRRKYAQGKLSHTQIAALAALGISWRATANRDTQPAAVPAAEPVTEPTDRAAPRVWA